MLQDIRRRSGGWVTKALIGAIAVTFVLWGTSSLWQLFIEEEKVAVVNDEAIYISQYESAFIDARRTAEQNLATLATLSRENQRELRQKVLENMINSILIRQAAEDDGLGLSPAQLDGAIVNEPTFQVNGRFEKQLYTRFLRSSRINSQEYKNYLLQQFKHNTYLVGLSSSAFFTPAMFQEYITWQHQEYTYRYAELPAPRVNRRESPTEDELRTYYEENTQAYFLPDRYRVRYIHLSQENTLPLVLVEESDLDSLYNERFGGALLQANITLYHILFNDPDQVDDKLLQRAENLRAGIKTLNGFKAVATEQSEDTVSAPEGGFLGNQLLGQLPLSFVDAVRGLSPGQKMPKAFRSELGVHLAWVEHLTDLDIPRYEEVREELGEEIRYTEVEELLLEKAESMADHIQSENELPPVSEHFPYEAKESDALTESSPLVREFGDAFLEELSLVEEGDASGVVWLDDGSFLSFEMLEKTPAELQSFDTAKAQVKTDYLVERAREKFAARLSQFASGINEDKLSIAEASKGLSPLRWRRLEKTSRAKEFKTETEEAILTAVSGRDVPFANYTQTEDGGYTLFVVEEVAKKSEEDFDEEFRLETRIAYRNQMYRTAERWILAHLNQKADININVVTDIGR